MVGILWVEIRIFMENSNIEDQDYLSTLPNDIPPNPRNIMNMGGKQVILLTFLSFETKILIR